MERENINEERKKIAELISEVENSPFDLSPETVSILAGAEAKAPVIGVTGPAGVGKSTFIASLLDRIKNKFSKIAVIMIDPSSSYSEGAFLGDRIRMKRHYSDESIFIRSMATRGARGGTARGLLSVIRIFNHFRYDLVIVETAGVGQDEIDIRSSADLVLLLLAPGAGDEIQVLKSGYMEIADYYLINRVEADGANELLRSVRDNITSVTPGRKVYGISALSGAGMDELSGDLAGRLASYSDNGDREARYSVNELLGLLGQYIETRYSDIPFLKKEIELVCGGKSGSYASFERIKKLLTGGGG